jgi:D-cysteine desulfhydrase
MLEPPPHDLADAVSDAESLIQDAPGSIRLLAARFPTLCSRLPVTSLGSYPSPVERLDALERAAGLPPATALWGKRDDLAGDLEPRGVAGARISKVRKLEHYLGDAVAAGARRVVTFGPLGSNHALATAVFGKRLGLEVCLGLWPEPITPRVRAGLRALVGLGARLELLGELGEGALAPGAGLSLSGGASDAPATVCIPPAGTDPVGALGYVECGLEIAEAVASGALPLPDFVHVAGGTGGVAAGLAVGLALSGAPFDSIPVVCVRAVRRGVLGPARIVLLARRLHARIRELSGDVLAAPPPGPRAFRLLHGHAGGGYGAPTEEAERATALTRAHTSLVLDPIYTAKAMAGLLAFARSPEGRGRRHLYLHTFAEADLGVLAAGAEEDALPEAIRRLVAES